MLTLNDTVIRYEYMGVFTGKEDWVHPAVTTETYELILVHEGKVYLEEGEVRYALSRGDYLLLAPHVPHRGYAPSGERTSFTWLHFYAENFEALAIPKQGRAADLRRTEYRLKELGHMAQGYAEACFLETELLSLLLGFRQEAKPEGHKLCASVLEYIRVHGAEPLTGCAVAMHFSYSADHLSRLLKQHAGRGLREYITDARLSAVKRALLSDTRSVKEIADSLGFEDGNRLSKFFKYHTGQTPGAYRRCFFSEHTNIK